MFQKTALLRGVAIIFVVLGHSCAYADGWFFRSVYSDFEQVGTWTTVQHYLMLTVTQLSFFAVPAFLLVTGMFMTYAVRGKSYASDWKAVSGRIKTMLPPFFLWSGVAIALYIIHHRALPSVDTIYEWLGKGEVMTAYYFVPLIIQFYLLAIFILPFGSRRPVSLLVSAIVVQVASILMVEVGGGYYSLWADIPGLGSADGMHFFTRWPLYFVLGVLLGTRASQVEKWLKAHRVMLGIGTIVFGALSSAQGAVMFERTGNIDWVNNQSRVLVLLYALFAMAFFFSLNFKPNRFKKILEHAGKISLSIYLIHPIILEVACAMGKKGFDATGFTLPLIVIFIILFTAGLLIPWGLTKLTKAKWFPFGVWGRKWATKLLAL